MDIAVIGVSCRLPGATGPEALWELLRDGRSAVVTRPDGAVGGFLDGADRFDAPFFGIAPAEAELMDPQQRLVLELAWEACEDAGVLPALLMGTHAGVFVGAIWDDYATLLHRRGPSAIAAHTMTGTHRSVIANRVSHHLGLRGPSMTVDTGQSSSLVAVHLACESLRTGASSVALAGGVNLILAPDSTLAAGRFGALSPDGRCHTFDARANGYVRGEGGGLVLLKPLPDALAAGDRVWCVIKGSAVNNDGPSPSLTTPSTDAQRDVLLTACAASGVSPSDVQYVELHGAGTPVGDPVEASALGAVFSDGLVVGSVKTNIGHLEGAAGIAGLLKTVLAVRHRELPASLNFATPHPAVPAHVRVATSTRQWPRPETPLVAGVSSFGMGGTNAHVIVAEPPHPKLSDPPATLASGGSPRPRGEHEVPFPIISRGSDIPWLLSAKSPAALRAQATALLAHVESRPELGDIDVAYSLATTRTHHEHRAVVFGRDALRRLAGGIPDKDVVTGAATSAPTVFVFPGQGSQWAGMAEELLDSSEVFRSSMQACRQALSP